MAMHCLFVSRGKPSEPPLSPEEEAKFEAADCLFRGALISVLADNIVNVYMHMPSGKDMWDALKDKFGFPMPVASCMSWSSSMTTRWSMIVL